MHSDDPEVKRLVRAAFGIEPANGKTEVKAFRGPITPSSYWSGGSRDWWAFVRLADAKAASLPESGSGYVPDSKPVETLPEGFALACMHQAGSSKWFTIYVPAENLSKVITAPVQLEQDENIVLRATRGLKSGYRREAVARLGITPAMYEAAVQKLIGRGFLNRAGAITTAGRNAIEPWSSWSHFEYEMRHLATA
jgi:hypothetical protein